MEPRFARRPDNNPVAAGPVAGQLIRFGIVGVAVNLALYGAYLAMLAGRVAPLHAMSVVYVCGVILSFLLHGHWSFGGQARRSRVWRFCVVYLAGYALNWAGLWALVDSGVSPQHAQALMVFAVAAMSFVLQKFWVFGAPSAKSPQGAEVSRS